MKKRIKPRIWALVAVLVAGLIFSACSFLGGEEKAPDKLDTTERLAVKKNIVVMGVDERTDDTGRSDTLFVVMLDEKQKQASLLSVPRDTLVRIPKHGWDKINHAFAYGGHRLTQQTVEEFLGIKINNYVQVDFRGFKGLVDALGGIDINVEKSMHYSDPYDGKNGLVINLEKGPQHLDGDKAIQYVRYRDEEGDIGRVRRQQKFLAAVYNKVTSVSVVPKLPELIRTAIGMLRTDLSLSDMLSLAQAIVANGTSGINMAMVPGDPVYIDEISYWRPDMTDLRQQMAEMQGAQMSSKYKLAAEKYEAEYDRVAPTQGAATKKNPEGGKEIKIITKSVSKEMQEAIKIAQKEEKKEEPKAVATPEAPLQPQAQAKQPQVAAKAPPSPPPVPKVRVKVVNCSERPELTARVAQMARDAGMEVVGTGTAAAINTSQIVTSKNTNTVLNKLSGLPFRYALRIVDNNSTDIDGIIYIGQDFQ